MSKSRSSFITSDSAAFQEAVDAVRSERLSVRQAAKIYGCATTTLFSHVRGMVKHQRSGRPTTFSELEERVVVRACIALGTFGYPATRELVGRVLKHYLEDVGSFSCFPSGEPSKKWWSGFFKRWPELTERKPQHLTIQRAKCCTPEIIEGFFTTLQEVLTDEGVLQLPYSDLASRLWNCDETGLCTSVTSTKVIVRRGDKQVVEIGSGSGREHITVLTCGSAVGEKLPPYVIYKAKTADPAWMENGPLGTRYASSDSGWMEEAQFTEWFRSVFLPATESLRKSKPVVLILDGHGSHISLKVVTSARQNNVVIFCLPPHTTHLLQPLDVSVFRTVKRVWKSILKEYKTEICQAVVTKKAFPSLLRKLWEGSVYPEHLVSGFRATGIHPLNSKVIRKDRLYPSMPYAQQQCSYDRPTGATPITAKVTSIFQQHFQAKLAKPASKGGRIRPTFYGESLTSEEAVKRLQEQQARRRKRVGRGKNTNTGLTSANSSSQENLCQGCGKDYNKDSPGDQLCWIGCDEQGCSSWYHYWCADFIDMPDPSEFWSCPACSH